MPEDRYGTTIHAGAALKGLGKDQPEELRAQRTSKSRRLKLRPTLAELRGFRDCPGKGVAVGLRARGMERAFSQRQISTGLNEATT
ncbi:hypothetical protein KM043_004591 [Ampulex compressa]|nr:hypothetical protein KM043_004591 [Ampulex compressa]